MRRHLLGLSAWMILLGATHSTRAAERAVLQDVALLKASGIATDGPGLVAFFRQRTRDRADETSIKTLIRRLGDDSFKIREKASKQLVTIGRALGRTYKPRSRMPIRKSSAALRIVSNTSARVRRAWR